MYCRAKDSVRPIEDCMGRRVEVLTKQDVKAIEEPLSGTGVSIYKTGVCPHLFPYLFYFAKRAIWV